MAESPGIKPPDLTPPQTPEQTAMLHYFRNSFRLTQGSAKGQQSVNDWAMSYGLIPAVDIPPQIPDYLLVRPPRMHLKSSEERIVDDRQMAYEDLKFVMEFGPRSTPEVARGVILSEILKKELRYQLIGRYGRGFNDNMFESYLRRSLVLGENFSSHELDKLLKELRKDLKKLKREPATKITDTMLSSSNMKELEDLFRSNEAQDQQEADDRMDASGPRTVLSYVEALWERNHPGERFFPEPPTTTQ